MRVTCKYCKAKIEKKDAFQVHGEKYNTYYCNKECYSNAIAKKEEAQKIKAASGEKKQRKIDPIYEEIADIFGYRIQNSALFAEMKLWRGICDDTKILAYLQENKDRIKAAMERASSSEYARIRYVSAILKNSLADYNVKNIEAEKTTPGITVDEDYIMPINKKKKTERRKGFGE